jgi:hypothetical protein
MEQVSTLPKATGLGTGGGGGGGNSELGGLNGHETIAIGRIVRSCRPRDGDSGRYGAALARFWLS